jgi:signal peptidase II
MTSEPQTRSSRPAPLPEMPAKSGRGWRILNLALAVVVLDQLTKMLVRKHLDFGEEWIVIEGFFKLVHWGNTGAAWSMFSGNNRFLAGVAIIALVILFFSRHHFNIHTFGGQISLGLIFGGIVGNLIDRVRIEHVVDFLYFFVVRRDGGVSGFPAFNVADSAICVGVGLLLILSWQGDSDEEPSGETRG